NPVAVAEDETPCPENSEKTARVRAVRRDDDVAVGDNLLPFTSLQRNNRSIRVAPHNLCARDCEDGSVGRWNCAAALEFNNTKPAFTRYLLVVPVRRNPRWIDFLCL